jgi:hypothetical protein
LDEIKEGDVVWLKSGGCSMTVCKINNGEAELVKESRSMNEGWVCPKCGRVNSPTVVACPCSLTKPGETISIPPSDQPPNTCYPYYPYKWYYPYYGWYYISPVCSSQNLVVK